MTAKVKDQGFTQCRQLEGRAYSPFARSGITYTLFPERIKRVVHHIQKKLKKGGGREEEGEKRRVRLTL